MNILTINDVVSQPLIIEKELKALFGRNERLLFMDIGACTGEDSIRYSNLFPKAKIISFEPLPGNIEIMRKHIGQFKKEGQIKIVQLALSDVNGTSKFFVSGGTPYKDIPDHQFTQLIPKEWNKSSSLLKPSSLMKKEIPWIEFNHEINIETRRLDDYMNEKNIAKVDFIHMDVQGAELLVLQGMGKFLQNVKLIWLEVENVQLYENQPLKKQINEYLCNLNFKMLKDTSISQSSGDCLYINKKFYSTTFKTTLTLNKLIERFKNI